ncbi:MAG: rRNA maturation RNase YbeY [Marinirhabdus sp.]
MVEFFSETDFSLQNKVAYASWISKIIQKENFEEGQITYVFCSDAYLHKLNLEFLQHDTLTDVIGFDSSSGGAINGEIYISVERVAENAKHFGVSFEGELKRVIVHGLLHFCGYKDKTERERNVMRKKENEATAIFFSN